MSNSRYGLRKFLLAVAITAGTAGIMSVPAFAAEWGGRGGPETHWGDRGHDRGDYRHADRDYHPVYDRDDTRRSVYWAPAPVVVVPQAVLTVPTAPAISFFIPLNFH